jgi:hypothetical protein
LSLHVFHVIGVRETSVENDIERKAFLNNYSDGKNKLVRVIRLPPVEEIARRWEIGMLATPPLPCPSCGKHTRAKYQCQWCKKMWNEGELDIRHQLRIMFYEGYDEDTRTKLRALGYYSMRVP